MQKYPERTRTNRDVVSDDEHQECDFRPSDNDCDSNSDPTGCNKRASEYSSILLPDCFQSLDNFIRFFISVCEVVCGVSFAEECKNEENGA